MTCWNCDARDESYTSSKWPIILHSMPSLCITSFSNRVAIECHCLSQMEKLLAFINEAEWYVSLSRKIASLSFLKPRYIFNKRHFEAVRWHMVKYGFIDSCAHRHSGPHLHHHSNTKYYTLMVQALSYNTDVAEISTDGEISVIAVHRHIINIIVAIQNQSLWHKSPLAS